MSRLSLAPILLAGLLLAGCASRPAQERPCAAASAGGTSPRLSPDREARILALDPEHISEREVRETLSNAPAPRLINIHGGRYPVFRHMISFSEFLAGMGYPMSSLTNPGNGAYSYSGYASSTKIAGAIAWHYEREGLRPMIVGHSLGGFQTVKVLQLLGSRSGNRVPVYNPIADRAEDRCSITDPLTGRSRPVAGLSVAYATAVGAGGLTRMLPNQWDMMTRLRKIPDSVDEFTGFYIGLDLLGGDYLGFGSANHYRATGKAQVRNVRLPTGSNHGTVPSTRHLLQNPESLQWIGRYRPADAPALDAKFKSDAAHILWAADVWYSIKKHWVLELQRLIRAQRSRRS